MGLAQYFVVVPLFYSFIRGEEKTVRLFLDLRGFFTITRFYFSTQKTALCAVNLTIARIFQKFASKKAVKSANSSSVARSWECCIAKF